MRVALDAYHVIALERVVLLQRLLFQVVFHKAVAVSADPQVAFSVEPEFYGIAPKLPALGIESTGYQRIGIDDVDIVMYAEKSILSSERGMILVMLLLLETANVICCLRIRSSS